MKIAKVLLITTLLGTSLLYSTSFNCRKASSKIEYLICGDNELSTLDEHLAIAYKNAKKYENPQRLKLEQRKWIHQRNVCTTVLCLQKSYTKRLATLEGYAKGEQPKPWSGTFQLGESDDKIVIKPSMSFSYTNITNRDFGCDIKGKFTKVKDRLEFHDNESNCHLKVSMITQNSIYIDTTPCQVNYCGINAQANSGKYERVIK